MTRPIRRTSDDWSVITTDELSRYYPPVPLPIVGVLQDEVEEGPSPDYVPPRLVPTERRENPRREIRVAIDVTLGGRDLCLDGLDLGPGGIGCAALPGWARVGDPILVHWPGRDRAILGRVAWCDRERDDCKLAGIRFDVEQHELFRRS